MEEEDLERQIWGGSDSELSSEGEDAPRQPRQRSSPRPPRPVREDGVTDGEDEEYQVEPRNLPKFKKSKKRAPAGDEARAAPKPRKKRARKEEAPPEDLPDETPDEKRRRELSDKINAAAKSGRSKGRKRKKGDEDDLDLAADEEVLRVKRAMEEAANKDQEANKVGQPAVAKLRMLPEVMEILQKTSLTQSIIDNNFLEAVRMWLEPLSDKSLPALNIQRALFEILGKMFIDTNTLKDSALGRIVLFYTKKNKRVTPPIKNAADNLIAQWSRPILKRSASYRDRDIPIAELAGVGTGPSRRIKLSAILKQGREEDAGRVRKNAVRIPERSLASFTVVPRSNVGGSNAAQHQDLERRRAAADRLRKVQRKLELAKQRTARM